MTNLKLNMIQKKLVDYLTDGINKGKHYFKSKYIAEDLGLTSKMVGTNLGILSHEYDKLKIEKWGYSKSTTWKVDLIY